MAKLIVHIAFFIYCQAANPNPAAPPNMVNGVQEVITDYKANKLWDNGQLMATTKLEECMFISYVFIVFL
ncbi:hypothetical protein LOAG_15667, partial [Loa loa]